MMKDVLGNWKKITIIFVTTIFLIFLTVFVIIPVFSIFREMRFQAQKGETFRDFNVRLEYFDSNRNDFEFLKELILENEIIYITTFQRNSREYLENFGNSRNCYSYNIKNEIFMCSRKEIVNISNIKDEIYNSYKRLDMVSIRIDRSFTGEGLNEEDFVIIFLLASGGGRGVSFEYCISDRCNTDDDFSDFGSSGYMYQNRIDDKWCTRFSRG